MLTKRLLAARVNYYDYVAKTEAAGRIVLYIKNR